ncbi:MAG: sodium:solute symporter, partial [Chitinophagia bacterium]|nr:sodium:solute symporter [Chitinophagia bacterium]
MSTLDWIVLVVTLCGIIAYGLLKSRTSHTLDGYFRSNRNLPWGLVLLSIMGTQASAITFLSAPGQAYTDGMRFVQYYFGIPLAMVVICIFFVPVFRKGNFYTAYEYLEQRFDGSTRTLTSFLFLLQRGLSTGISVFAPSLILSSLMGWDLIWTNILLGGLLIIYTISGGAKAVAYTQQLQLTIVFTGMFLAGWMAVRLLPADVGFSDALAIGGQLGKFNVISSGIVNGKFDWSDQYNIWSGLIGGFFLALSYFGTDQSQVGRYLTAQSLRESRMGLLMNGFVKVPMQFLILLIGVLVFSFYQFKPAPIFFNQGQLDKLSATAVYGDSLRQTAALYQQLGAQKTQLVQRYARLRSSEHSLTASRDLQAITLQKTALVDSLRVLQQHSDSLRARVKYWIGTQVTSGDSNDTNYIFLKFVVDHLPAGLVGLLIAIIFLASWGSIAAAINSLASSTMIDFHKRFSTRDRSSESEYRISKWYTLGWGIFCIAVAMFTYNIGNSLIEAVNVLGSLFYGVVLGIFLVAFFIPRVKSGTLVFWAALLAELIVIAVFLLSRYDVIDLAFLWLNPLGALLVVALSVLLQLIAKKSRSTGGTTF